jgi:hypothetical protein
MVTSTVSPPIITQKVTLKGSQSLTNERIRRAMSPNGGPGIIGRIQPTKPERARMSPNIIREVVSMGSKYQPSV